MIFGSETKQMGKIDSILGVESDFKGNFVAKGTIRVDGKIEGALYSEDGVIISESGIVRGDIAAKYVVIGGKVTGDVDAQMRVEMLPSAQLFGDIRAPRLIIAEGVIFEGKCEMIKEKPDSIKKQE